TLTDLERDLEAGRVLRAGGECWANALPLAAALGRDDATAWPAALETQFGELWAARRKPTDREQLWQKQREAEKSAPDLLRQRLTAYLLRQAGDPKGGPDDADTAADLLHMVSAADPGAPRPAEAHFLLMLRAYDR